MIHFDERRHHHSTRRPAEEEPLWKGGGWTTKSKKASRKKETPPVVKTAPAPTTTVVPKTRRIDVVPEYKSGLYRNVYWMHPNQAITRESRGEEEFVGEFTFYQAVNSNVIVNFFPGLDYSQHAKLRFAHTAHTPPTCRASFKPSDDYLQKNMEILLKKMDILAFQQSIMDSRPAY